jgi:hypothetical protein
MNPSSLGIDVKEAIITRAEAFPVKTWPKFFS